MRGLRILFLVRRFYPDIGGVETHALRVAEELVRNGNEVIVICESESPADTNYDRKIVVGDKRGVDRYVEQESSGSVSGFWSSFKWHFRYISAKLMGVIKIIALSGQLMQSPDNLLKLPVYSSSSKSEKEFIDNIIVYRLPKVNDNRIKKFIIWMCLLKNKNLIVKNDIIHCHDVFFWYLPFRLLYWSRKVYTTFHGYEGTYPPSKKAIRMRKLSEKLSYGNICVGDFISKWYSTKPDAVTYGGVESKFPVSPSAGGFQLPVSKKTLKLLFVGRLAEDTGVKIYLEALKLLKQKKKHYSFEVCGDGDLRQDAEKYGRVHGFVKNVQPYIQKADIVFASSYLSILEASAMGKPVVAVFTNPLKEDYLKMTPFAQWVTIAKDGEEICDVLEDFDGYMKENKLKIEKAQKWAREQTWRRVTDMYLELWKK